MPACAQQCQVVQDVQLGWDDFCIGLTLLNSTSDVEFCRRSCCQDPNCEVWQWGNRHDLASTEGLGLCYNGKGLECSRERMDDFVAVYGQRISHGDVLDSGTDALPAGTWCTGVGMRQANASMTGLSKQQQTSVCQGFCYADATCSIWQYSMYMGCWYGAADGCSVVGNGDIVGGERVARLCGESAVMQMQTDPYKVFGIICLVAFVFTCCALTVLLGHAWLFRSSYSSASGKSRSANAAPEEDDEEEAGFLRGQEQSFARSAASAQAAYGLPQRAPSAGRSETSSQSWSAYQSGLTASVGAAPLLTPPPTQGSSQPSFGSSVGSSFPGSRPQVVLSHPGAFAGQHRGYQPVHR